MVYDKECVFCKILDGDEPAHIIAESDTAIALMDKYPLTLGHAMVIPKKHRVLVQDMTPEEVKGVFKMVAELMPRVDKLGGSTLMGLHNGEAAGQVVPHVHVHLVPRYADEAGAIHDMFPVRAKCTDKEMAELADRLRS